MVPDYVATAPRASDGRFKTYDYNKDACHQALLDAGFSEEQIAAGINVGTILTYNADTAPKAKAAVVIQACFVTDCASNIRNLATTDRFHKDTRLYRRFVLNRE